MSEYKQYFLHCNGALVHVFKKNHMPTIDEIQDVLTDRVGLYGPAVMQSCEKISDDLSISSGLNGIHAHLEEKAGQDGKAHGGKEQK